MRSFAERDGLSVRTIAGCHGVWLGFGWPSARARELRGFAICRTAASSETPPTWLVGTRTFEHAPEARPASRSTVDHPIQDFAWLDETVDPGCRYTYRVLARGGAPGALTTLAEVAIEVATEGLEGDHAVYFTRGVTATAAYLKRFGDRSPDEVGEVATRWLSRGAEDAVVRFLAEAEGNACRLRVAAALFRNEPVARALAAARTRGVDVAILYDATDPGRHTAELALLARHGLTDAAWERSTLPRAVAHNTFVVRSRGGEPDAVLTGSLHFSTAGLQGRTAAVHICRLPEVARQYAEAWEVLHAHRDAPRVAITRMFDPQIPGGGSPGTHVIFSPRSRLDALEHYARQIEEATGGVFGAFGLAMNMRLRQAFRDSHAPVRFAVSEALHAPTRSKGEAPLLDAEMRALRAMPQNRIAVGGCPDGALGRWMRAQLAEVGGHERYAHGNVLIVDPLGRAPLVITGSGNFSNAAAVSNDENMLCIQGDTRVADLYLVEYLRLWRDVARQEWRSAHTSAERARPWWLDDGGGPTHWTDRYLGGADDAVRRYFGSAPAPQGHHALRPGPTGERRRPPLWGPPPGRPPAGAGR